jgi:hypothetical protein
VTATIHSVLADVRANATSSRDLGNRFEQLMRAYLSTDPLYPSARRPPKLNSWPAASPRWTAEP